jgi:hypothetical protein
VNACGQGQVQRGKSLYLGVGVEVVVAALPYALDEASGASSSVSTPSDRSVSKRRSDPSSWAKAHRSPLATWRADSR